ncbi:uncharacterized protein N0V89_005310 [Didymosphaeria variabile]|uniref:DUF8212 domain-containing protein n=1 Tax=Didymosphaeria variabile TaxID=1932322 RepID=A0A9W8XMX8_9PLEO|nr:uncharacterized protein N0V89_005310 [Didymosphaeria variabile]KAJ4353580.1 hypothetical protein N0V89_005310 [Didymosphaeria variabile]
MAWAANRETTRPEDKAYSLLGLFDLHMPLIYGEGLNKAFTRLQAEILRDSADHSILAWSTESSIIKSTVAQPHLTSGGPIDPQDHITVALATQPKLFALCKNIATILVSDARPIEMTSKGLKIDLRLIRDFRERNVDYYIGALACHEEDDFATYGGIPLLQHHGQKDSFFRDPRRPLVKVPVAEAEDAPLRTVYLAIKANVYPTSDALRYAVPQHFLLRHTEEDGMQDWEIHAQPAERWNQVTRTMQFRGMGVRQRRGILTIRANTPDKTHSFSFVMAFGIELNAPNETSGNLSSVNDIYRPQVRLFHDRNAELDDEEWFGATTDEIAFREHLLRVYVKHEILFAKPVFVLQLRLRRRPAFVRTMGRRRPRDVFIE